MNSPAVVFPPESSGRPDLVELTMEACKVAKDAATSAMDGLISGSASALQSVRDCEEKLDDLDRELDQQLAGAISQVTPTQARELLACMKLMLDLERVGDLIASFAERTAIIKNRLDMEDIAQLTKMACLLENMLGQMFASFKERDVNQAIRVLRSDTEMDRLRNLLVVRHTEDNSSLRQESLHVLAMANALERAGDHVKNMAEELCHLSTGQTVRHLIRCKDKPFEQLFLDWLAKQTPSKP